jgi:hypothetical protein
MDPKTKKRLIIGLSITTILGVGGYFLFKYFKDNNMLFWKGENDDGDGSNYTPPSVTPPNTSLPAPSNPSQSVDRPADVLAFQKWANANGYTPKLDEDGLWGPNTKRGWTAKKSAYQSAIGTPTVTTQGAGLTGQLKWIFDYWQTNGVKGLSVVPGSSTGNTYVCGVGNSGRRYCYGEGGVWYAYDTAGKVLMNGNFANNGKTIVVTAGSNKGKTFTGATPMTASGSAVYNPQVVSNLTTVQQADIVAKMYDAMKGPGTWDMTFNKQFDRLKTLQDWKNVFAMFGTKEGENLAGWMKGEKDLMTYTNKKKYNDWFKKVGHSRRF